MVKLPPGPLPVNVTTYCPFHPDSGSGASIEGGVNDRKGKPLHTFEQHQSDPVAHPFVSVSADPDFFTYGQLLFLPFLGDPTDEWKAAAGSDFYRARVVDTGSHFHGATKVYRHAGYEPIDVCVDFCGKQSFPTGQQQAEIVNEGFFKNALRAVANTLGGGSLSTALVLLGLTGVALGLAYFSTSGGGKVAN